MAMFSVRSSNNFSVPVITSVTVTSSKSNPIRPVGSDVTLTCTVELSTAVDVPVTVNTMWTGPDALRYSSDSVLENITSYTSTINISSFGRNQSGNYTCNSSVSFLNNSGSQSTTTEVTVGKGLKHLYQ